MRFHAIKRLFLPVATVVLALAEAPLAQVNIRINFEPAGFATPLGYDNDIGAAYSASRGRGWVTEASLGSATRVPLDLRSQTLNRARAGIDPRLNTFIQMQPPTATAGAYECNVPNGLYKVVVSVGDRSPYASQHSIRVEGAPVISGFVGSAAQEYKRDSVVVNVSDGRLTVDAIGGAQTKLNYLHIVASGAPEPPPVNLRINFQNPATVPPAGHLADFGQAFGPRTGANQGSGLSYGWVVPGTGTPRDLSIGGTVPGNGRKRRKPAVLRLATFMHMQADQLANFNGTPLPGSWEIALPNAWYTVTVGVGDAQSFDSRHRILVEGLEAIPPFTPTAANPFFAATVAVQVTDGRLTLAATDGSNTKITHALIRTGISSAARPSVSRVTPSPAALGVPRDAAVTAEVLLPNGPVNGITAKTSTVQLFRSADNLSIPAQVNSTGGGDALILQPSAPLEANKGYRFEVSQGVQDDAGRPFLPFSSHFTTGSAFAFQPTAEIFDTVSLGAAASGRKFTSLAMGPDGRLYAGTLTGHILRFDLNPDGTVQAPLVINSLRQYNGNLNRAIIGMAFDPASTSAAPILWVSDNAPTLNNSADWSGRITRLSGPDLSQVQNYVTGLPRATKDHMTNSLAFGPDGALYVSQGSRSANGAYDGAWKGEERLLSAAVLRVELNAIAAPPALDVKTEEGGAYNPFAPGAPVTLYATGVRNAYDLVWHTNGSLYLAGNSSAAGGNTPGTPSPLPAACADRIDKASRGPYTGPLVTGFTKNPLAQPDFLHRILPGRYYGHPNPRRCEWVLNGGNPTAGVDEHEESLYPVGTLPDRNWEKPDHVFGLHFSPNGTLEYRRAGTLQGKLLVARYSAGDDILVLTLDPVTHGVAGTQLLNVQGAKFADPLDLAENPANGNLYVTEYAAGRITLLKPR